MFAAKGGEIPAHIRHLATILHPKYKFAEGGMAKGFKAGKLKAAGGKVAGTPKVNRDSYSNDTVKTLLSPGEIVIPLHVINSKDPVGETTKFVQGILAKKGKVGNNSESDDFKKALTTAIKSRKQ